MKKNVFLINCPLCFAKENYRVLYQSTLEKKDFTPFAIRNHLKNTLGDYRKHGRIVKCNNCNLVYVNPLEDALSLFKGYKEVVDYEYLKMERYRKILLTNHLRTVEEFKKPGKLLDVGCFTGFFLELAQEQGWETWGIEPSIWAKIQAKKRGIRIIGEDIGNIGLKKSFFDTVTLWDVIEHLPYPKKTLKNIRSCLKNKGVLAIGTPNIESFVAKILKGKFPFLGRMHLMLYSPKTLKRLLQQSGFDILCVKSYGRIYPLYYILERLKINNPLYNKFEGFIKSKKSIANLPINLNIGDSFVMVARKN